MIKKIAVLLAAYNGEKWISEQLKSITDQISVDITVFISCDLSTDNTIKIIKELNNEKIKLLPYGEKFGAAAPNFYRLIKDVDFAGFDYVAFSDQDDIWLDDKLFSGIEKLQRENADAYSSNVIAFWANGKKKEIVKATPQKKYDYLFEGPGPGCSFILTTEFAEEFKNYIQDKDRWNKLKELDWHDWLIYAYARKNGYKWVIDSNSHMLYRQHSDNQLGANSGFKQLKKRVKDVLSGYGISQSLKTVDFLNMRNDAFVSKWWVNNKVRYFKLAKYSELCRRRNRDVFLFFCSCILMTLKGRK